MHWWQHPGLVLGAVVLALVGLGIGADTSTDPEESAMSMWARGMGIMTATILFVGGFLYLLVATIADTWNPWVK